MKPSIKVGSIIKNTGRGLEPNMKEKEESDKDSSFFILDLLLLSF